MLYAFKLGPIRTGEGDMTGFFGVTPERALEPHFGKATAAQKSFAKQASGPLMCEEALAPTGRAFGYAAVDAPKWAAVPRAILSFGLALGTVAPAHGSAIDSFLTATHMYLAAMPWQFWNNDDVIEVEVTRAGETKTYEGCVMGAGGLEFGLALYPEKGSIARLSRSASFQEGREIDSLALTMDDEPTWAADSLADGYGLDGIPFPISLRKKRPHAVSAAELATLAIALRAIAQLRSTARTASITLDDDEVGCRMTATVRAPRTNL